MTLGLVNRKRNKYLKFPFAFVFISLWNWFLDFSNFPILISLQPDIVNHWYYNLLILLVWIFWFKISKVYTILLSGAKDIRKVGFEASNSDYFLLVYPTFDYFLLVYISFTYFLLVYPSFDYNLLVYSSFTYFLYLYIHPSF